MNNRRSSDVLPAPEGPVRKWNEPGRKWKFTSDSTSAPRSYFKARLANRITGCHGLQAGPQAGPELQISSRTLMRDAFGAINR